MTRSDTMSFICLSRSALGPAEAPGHQLSPPVFSGRLDVWRGGDWYHGPAEEDDGSCWQLPIHSEAAAPGWEGWHLWWGHDVKSVIRWICHVKQHSAQQWWDPRVDWVWTGIVTVILPNIFTCYRVHSEFDESNRNIILDKRWLAPPSGRAVTIWYWISV